MWLLIAVAIAGLFYLIIEFGLVGLGLDRDAAQNVAGLVGVVIIPLHDELKKRAWVGLKSKFTQASFWQVDNYFIDWRTAIVYAAAIAVTGLSIGSLLLLFTIFGSLSDATPHLPEEFIFYAAALYSLVYYLLLGLLAFQIGRRVISKAILYDCSNCNTMCAVFESSRSGTRWYTRSRCAPHQTVSWARE